MNMSTVLPIHRTGALRRAVPGLATPLLLKAANALLALALRLQRSASFRPPVTLIQLDELAYRNELMSRLGKLD
jgi:hypothetical protein